MPGVEWTPISPVSRSICSPLPFTAPSFRSMMPSFPNDATGAPVFAFNSTRRYPVVTYTMRSSPLPSVQYETPRPESWRGATAARLPSRMLCTQTISPVRPSSAITSRRVPAVVYRMPRMASGVPSSLYSGKVPKLSVLNRHATSSLLKLSALI